MHVWPSCTENQPELRKAKVAACTFSAWMLTSLAAMELLVHKSEPVQVLLLLKNIKEQIMCRSLFLEMERQGKACFTKFLIWRCFGNCLQFLFAKIITTRWGLLLKEHPTWLIFTNWLMLMKCPAIQLTA